MGTPSLDSADGTLTWRRRRAENLRSPQLRQSEENFTDGDDEILESLVKTATKAPGNRTTPRERKRTRHADRKSCEFYNFLISWSLCSPFPENIYSIWDVRENVCTTFSSFVTELYISISPLWFGFRTRIITGDLVATPY